MCAVVTSSLRIIRRERHQKKRPEGYKASAGRTTERQTSCGTPRQEVHTLIADLHGPSPELCPPLILLKIRRLIHHRWCSGLGPGRAPSASIEGLRTLQGSKIKGKNHQPSVQSFSRATNTACKHITAVGVIIFTSKISTTCFNDIDDIQWRNLFLSP